MKSKGFFITFSCILMLFSCEDDDNADVVFANFLVAKPLTVSKDEYRETSVQVVDSTPIIESGKMYAYKDYVFVNDKNRGVHVIDNSNPESPEKISFIKIAGNVDISIKDDYLYADSLADLVVLDIADISDVKIVDWLEGVFPENFWFGFGVTDIAWPQADIYDFDEIDFENEVLLGWEVVEERRAVPQYDAWDDLATINDAGSFENSGDVGQGGSLARFKIVDDHLYVVDSHNINVFDISDLESPKDLEDVFVGFDIETIFNRGAHLFLGSMQGMYIYDITAPSTPTYVAEFQHGTACDPVVVDDSHVYVTLRGGNFCGATESGLYIIDISTITMPKLEVIYPMDEPYGLGIKGDKLFICDGSSGLKVYDKSAAPNIEVLDHFKDIVTFDVIPLKDNLLMVGDGILYQYEYLVDGIRQISEFQLN